ncbi:hypothetical protein F8388_016298 [Cannabis sativa]|uniref:Uncharacterized protein n=1 Tax=Cannabis sativa TaxID=3483 RepID=A0A7J6E2P8_CANSA|nr:hypothetical protein F8388_016298 [Cannabis sativa]
MASLKLNSLCNTLASVGEPISSQDHLGYLLNGLGPEYNAFVTTILARPIKPAVEEVHALLLLSPQPALSHPSPSLSSPIIPISPTPTTASSTSAPSSSSHHIDPLMVNLHNPHETTIASTNVHPMITIAKSGIRKPRVFYGVISGTPVEPSSFQEASIDPRWNSAMDAEIVALD